MATDIANGNLSGGAATVTFAVRYNVIEIKNLDTTNPMFATTNGNVPTSSPGPDEYLIGPGERVSIPNTGPLWYQGFSGSTPGTTVKLAGTGTAEYEVVGAG